MILYILKFKGHFAYIKPWTAVRDEKTFSQQFLTPSMVIGLEKKLFPELLPLDYDMPQKVVRHRLIYSGVVEQQEQTQSRGWNKKGRGNNASSERPRSILTRGVLLYPELYLAFANAEDAVRAAEQHICLARNEDLMFPEGVPFEVDEAIFSSDGEQFPGIELLFQQGEGSFLVGYNRFAEGKPMYGKIHITKIPNVLSF